MKFRRKKFLIIIIGLLFILSLNFFQKEVKGFFYSISEPVQKVFWRSGSEASNLFGSIFEAKNLKKENEALNLKIQELFSVKNSLRELDDENKTLREALGVGLQKEFRLELVNIIGKDIDRNAILINRGQESGISKGLFLITSQKVLIGRVEEVYRSYSKILLISDKESSFEAKISGSNVSGLLKGLGGFRVLLDLIPKDEEVKEGDLVVSSGFLVGLIKKVEKIDVNPFLRAEISPLFDISNLDKAFIVLDFQNVF